MRADENLTKRTTDRHKLLAFLERHRVGDCIPIESWYSFMRGLGLEHSARQRLSELRDLGYSIDFDRKDKVYRWMGKPEPGQLSLLEVNG